MKNTGERHILDEVFNNEAEYYIHLMHLATYQYALNFANGKKVLDYGCGSGYGSHLLSTVAKQVVAVDISTEAIDFAKQNYSSPNLVFKTISELSDEKFDIITSFQVIEHVPKDKEYIEKLKYHLNPEGIVFISTPDKKNRLFNYIQKPWNKFHLKEYNYNSLNKLLQKYFKEVTILKIGSSADFIYKEISRTKKQRLITLPCTLSIYPNSLRVFLLDLQTSLYKRINRKKANKKSSTSVNYKNQIDFTTKYSINDIEIAEQIKLSTDLLAICKF